MPEMWFDIIWPDGREERCYSPSLIVKEKLSEGQDYKIADFMALSRAALGEASERVRAKYGFPCSRALGQLARLEQGCAAYARMPDAVMRVDKFLDKA